MVATIPADLVEKPTPSQPLRYGLFAAANGPLELTTHGTNGGVKYTHAMCGTGECYEINCIDAQGAKTEGDPLETVNAVPFLVTSEVVCGPVGYDLNEWKALTIQRIQSVEQAVVEATFSTGLCGQSPPLSGNPNTVTVASTATSIYGQIGQLEAAFYATQYGPPGYLHVGMTLFEALKSDHLIEFSNGRWRTALGTVVSAGVYANVNPVGVPLADGVFAAYMTGQTTVWRQNTIHVAPIGETLDRTLNQIHARAERYYAVAYECASYYSGVTLWTP